MFDINEYYQNSNYKSADFQSDLTDIEEDITYDIDNLLKNRFDRLYMRDRYKYENNVIEIIFPKITYPGNRSLIINSDKIRFLLSFYPEKKDFQNINKIVLRPRYIEIANIELVSLYMRHKKILVLYLSHPHHYDINDSKFNKHAEFLSNNMEKIIDNKLLTTSNKDTMIKAHPLWYLLSIISYPENNSESSIVHDTFDKSIYKFFVKRSALNSKTYRELNDISFFFSQHGY